MKSPIQREAESRLRSAITAVEKIMPNGMGVAVLVFERGTDEGSIGYIANARREDMRRALTEFLKKWDADAAGAPFYPLTLEAFEAWVATCPLNKNTLTLVKAFRRFSNDGPTNTEEVSQQ